VERPLAAFTALLKIGVPRAPGPAPTYNSSHVLLAMLTIGGAEVIGRHALAKEAGLGEGAVRTVIKWLKEDGYIKVRPDGCQLTAKGKQAYSELRGVMPRTLELSETALSVGREQVAVLVKKRSDLVRSGIEQRDSSIKAGADGATTYVVKGSKFQVPGSSADAEKDFPGLAWTELRSGLQPESGDVVIVCGSDDKRTSFIGAISAALTLLT
jgi:Mn-dependent DtxR family transcriptional regulator